MREMIKGAQSASAAAGTTGALPGAPGQPSSGGNDLYLLGDSVLVGAYFDNGAPLKKNLDSDGWSSLADASGGRGMTYKGSDPRGNLPGRNDSGLDAIKSDASTIKASDTVV